MDKRIRRAWLSRAGMVAIAVAAAPAVMGGQATADSTASVEEVTVTGSRIARGDFTAPTPTTTLNASEIERTAPNNLAEVIRELPAYRATAAATTNAISGPASTIDLRGLGAGRTLTLVNGRRFQAAGYFGGVADLNLIPTSIIDRVEIVTGGASAAWGSDAVAGTVNVILKDDLQGVEASVQGGQSKYNDDRSAGVSIALGTGFNDNRGHIVVAAEYSNDEGVFDRSNREDAWIHHRGAVFNFTPPYTIFANNLQWGIEAPGGMINDTRPAAAGLYGLTFQPNGTIGRMTLGQYPYFFMIGGGQPGNDFNYLNQYIMPARRYTVYSHASYQLSDKIRASLEATIGQTVGDYRDTPNRDSALIASIDNPYMPAAVRSQIVGAGLTYVSVGRQAYNELGDVHFVQTNQNRRFMGSLDGKVSDAGNWRWDAYYQYTTTPSLATRDGANSRNMVKFALATDVVTNPANGQPVCRSTLTDPTNGCVPYNFFGENLSSQASRTYFQADGWTIGKSTSNIVAANLKGDAFKLPAGPISVAMGAEYRNESTSQSLDPVAAAGGFEFSTPQPAYTSASGNVKEVYLEVLVPLLKDAFLAKHLDLDLAGRHTDYSTSGGVNTWKAGVSWELASSFKVRGTLSQDIRAANLSELFAPATFAGAFVPNDSVLHVPALGVVTTTGSGNPDLQPEKARTWTGGFVYQPSWVQGLRASVDYFNIDIKNEIIQENGQFIIDRCAQGLTSYCGFILRNSDPSNPYITGVVSPYLNLGELKTSGVDLEASWDTQLPHLPGNFNVRALATYTRDLISIDHGVSLDTAGQLGSTTGDQAGVPHWQGTLTFTYRLKGFSGSLQGRFVGAGNINNLAVPGTATSQNINTVPSQTLWNLSASYNIREGVQVYGLITNLTDQNPPFPFQPSSLYPSGYYDGVGRAFRLGARVKF